MGADIQVENAISDILRKQALAEDLDSTTPNEGAIKIERRQSVNACLASPCNFLVPFSSCLDQTCYCRVFLSVTSTALADCSDCLRPSNPGLANSVEEQDRRCRGARSSSAKMTAGITQCSGQCNDLFSAAITCSNEPCACPTILIFGETCSQCLQSFNPAAAGIVGSAISDCLLVQTSTTSAIQGSSGNIGFRTMTSTSIAVTWREVGVRFNKIGLAVLLGIPLCIGLVIFM